MFVLLEIKVDSSPRGVLIMEMGLLGVWRFWFRGAVFFALLFLAALLRISIAWLLHSSVFSSLKTIPVPVTLYTNSLLMFQQNFSFPHIISLLDNLMSVIPMREGSGFVSASFTIVCSVSWLAGAHQQSMEWLKGNSLWGVLVLWYLEWC